jgi:hypothetical protein
MHKNGAIFTEVSENAKIGVCSATMVAQVTCPPTCPLRGNGCYGESGPLGIHFRRMGREATSADDVIRAECELIRASKNLHLPLRLHVVGDCLTEDHAHMLAHACEIRKGPVWTYTHSWRTIPRSAFGAISVMASCESLAQVAEARGRGYSASLVIPRDVPNPRAYIICPSQVTGVTCVECRLCLNADRLKRPVAFGVHGARAKAAAAAAAKAAVTPQGGGTLGQARVSA